MPDMAGVSEKLNQGAKTFGSFLSSAFNKAGKTVSEAGSKIKKSVAENVSICNTLLVCCSECNESGERGLGCP